MIDGAYINKSTLKVAEELQKLAVQYNNRTISVIPKWQRGGVVSSSNLGLNFVTGEIVVKVDGDSSKSRRRHLDIRSTADSTLWEETQFNFLSKCKNFDLYFGIGDPDSGNKFVFKKTKAIEEDKKE